MSRYHTVENSFKMTTVFFSCIFSLDSPNRIISKCSVCSELVRCCGVLRLTFQIDGRDGRAYPMR